MASTASTSFADRIAYFPFNVEETSNSIERQYLLGGSGDSMLADKEMDMDVDLESMTLDTPMPTEKSIRVVEWANFAAFFLASGLLAICVYESTDSLSDDEHCPLLIVGAVLSGLVILNAMFGFIGVRRRDTDFGSSVLYANHMGALWSMLLLIMLAIATLIHWDVGGAPAHNLFHARETKGVRFRFLIWGLALATSLNMVVIMFGSLGLKWPTHDRIYQTTLRIANIFLFITGAAIVACGVAVWYHDELRHMANPFWIIGASASGAALTVVGLIGLAVSNKVNRINHYLVWLPLVSLAVIFFSIGNAVTAEPEKVSDRRTNQLLAALIGLWSQIISVVAIVAASQWRFYVKSMQL